MSTTMAKRTRVRSPNHRRKYLWCGTSRAETTFRQYIEPKLKKAGFTCSAKITSPTDLPSRLPPGLGFIILTGGRGSLQSSLIRLVKNTSTTLMIPPKHSWGEIRRLLIDHNFLDEYGKSLYGFFDEEAAANPGPVMNPVLTLDDLEKADEEAKSIKEKAPVVEASGAELPADKALVFVTASGEVMVSQKRPGGSQGTMIRAKTKPVTLVGEGYTALSLAELSTLMGRSGSRKIGGSEVARGWLTDAQGKQYKVRWATVEECVKAGAERGEHLDGYSDSRTKGFKRGASYDRPDGVRFEVFKEGKRVKLYDVEKHRVYKPTVYDGRLYFSSAEITKAFNISQPTLSGACRRSGMINGKECRFATMNEVMTHIEGTWRNSERDKIREKKPRRKKQKPVKSAAVLPPVAAPPSKQDGLRLRVLAPPPEPEFETVASPPVRDVSEGVAAIDNAPAPMPASLPASMGELVKKLSDVQNGVLEVEVAPGVRTKINLGHDEQRRLTGELVAQMTKLTGGG